MDPRWVPLSELLRPGATALPAPFVVTETSHPGVDRPLWWQMIGQRVRAGAARAGSAAAAACASYPCIDRPDWDHLGPVAPLRPLGCRAARPPARPAATCTTPAPEALRQAQAAGAAGPGPGRAAGALVGQLADRVG
ncbi:MAG: hypothetical protein WKG07_38550 [Hymenobacter sp.]